MQSGRAQTGFTMIEMAIVLAMIGVIVAIAVPSFDRYRSLEEAKETATEIAAALRRARSLAVKEGVPYLVIFNPNQSGAAIPAPNPPVDPGALARVVRDANADSRETGGETVFEIIPQRMASFGVTPYRGPGIHPAAPRIGTDVQGGTLNGIAEGANFPIDGTTGVPAVAFTPRGVAVPLGALQNLGAGAGSYYVTDNNHAVFAATVGPLGAVRIRAYSPGANAWR